MSASTAVSTAPAITLLPVLSIAPSPMNPRKHFDQTKLSELADSIRQKGVRSPLEVRHAKKRDGYEIIAGERRWRAAQQAGHDVVPCIVSECSDAELVEIALTENGQREDMTPMDEARAYQSAMKANAKHYTVAVVAGTVGKSESYVYRRLKLLELAAPLQEALDETRLSIAHAERLVKLTTDKQLQAAGIEKGKFNSNGVIWRFSPLFVNPKAEKDWKPGLEDLQPLHQLDEFIRMKTTFSPTEDGLKYLQPELVQQLDVLIQGAADDIQTDDEDCDEEAALAEAKASIVSVTTDPMARMRMGLKANDPMPLTPSKWREVKPGKECEYTRPGVITHGSTARPLKVCIKKSCAKHWPVKKKAKAGKSAPAKRSTPAYDWEAEDRKRQAEALAWKQLLAETLPALAEFTAGVTFTAALVRSVLDQHTLRRVSDEFGVALTESTAAQVLLLSSVSTHHRPSFLSDLKSIAPKLVPKFQSIEAAQKKAATAVKPDKPAATAKAKKAAKK